MIRAYLSSLAMAAAIFMLTGCAPEYTRQRGKLSEAMNKASDENKGSRKVADTKTDTDEDENATWCIQDDEDDNDYTRAPATPAAPTASGTPPTDLFPDGAHSFCIEPFTGVIYSSHYSSISGALFSWSNHFKPQRSYQLEVGLATIPTDTKSDLYGSIGDIFQLQLGGKYRMYATPDHTFMGLFYQWGADGNLVLWNYKNAIYSDVRDEHGHLIDTETITGDGLFGFSINSGLGWSLVQSKYFKLSTIVSGVAAGYWINTTAGFENDVIHGDLSLRLSLECALGMPQNKN